MSEITYSKEEALKIAYAMHMQGGLDNLVDPESGKTVGQGLAAPKEILGIETGGYGGDREAIWKKILQHLEAKLKNEPSPYSAERLSELTDGAVSADAITIAAKGAGITGSAVSVDVVKPKANEVPPTTPEAAAQTNEDSEETPEGGVLGYFKGVGKRVGAGRENNPFQGGIMDVLQRLVLAFFHMFSDVERLDSGNNRAQETKIAKTEEVQQQQEQLSQQVQVAQAQEKTTQEQEAEKIAAIAKQVQAPAKELERDMVVANIAGDSTMLQPNLAKNKDEPSLADLMNLKPTPCPNNAVAQSRSTDFGMGRGILS